VTWRLHVVASPDEDAIGCLVDVGAKGLLIGRNPSGPGSFRVSDAMMSRGHAVLSRAPHGDTAELEDQDSHNGSFHGGLRVKRARLMHGAVLRFGSTVCVLEADGGRAMAHARPSRNIPGHSERARVVRQQLTEAAGTAEPVLVRGPTGTGKEHAAAELHRCSQRTGALVRLNTSALPAQLFESELFGHARGAFSGAVDARMGRVKEADRGVLLLDEIGELELGLQPKLLRLLEEGHIRPVGGTADLPVDVKFVASTNADLDAKVAAGQFRADLLARLRFHEVVLPILCDRRADLMEFADLLLTPPSTGELRATWASALQPETVEALLLWHWPDNLRELKRVLYRLVASPHHAPFGTEALPDDIRKRLPRAAQGPVSTDPDATSRTAEMTGAPRRAPAAGLVPPKRPHNLTPPRAALEELLVKHAGNVEAVARELGRERRQIYRWMAAAGIDPSTLGALRRPEET